MEPLGKSHDFPFLLHALTERPLNGIDYCKVPLIFYRANYSNLPLLRLFGMFRVVWRQGRIRWAGQIRGSSISRPVSPELGKRSRILSPLIFPLPDQLFEACFPPIACTCFSFVCKSYRSSPAYL